MLGLAAVACLGLRGDRRAEACVGLGYTIVDLTTFDPTILPDTWDGLNYDPLHASYGGACTDDCAKTAIVKDWHDYLNGAVTDADWEKVLFHASTNELAGLTSRLAGKSTPIPPGYENSSLWKATGPAKDKLKASLALVDIVRTVEPLANLTGGAGKPPNALLEDARNGLKAAAKDPFLAQRYAFQILRILFYQRDWAGAVAYYDRNTAQLAAPSVDVLWHARYYVAGALMRSGQTARANLELARIHASYMPLAGAAAEDFRPKEDGDWRDALKLARDVREKAMLWRLAGIRQDGIAAMQEIFKLDPKSPLFALLMVREIEKAEAKVISMWGPPDPKDVAARKTAFVALASIAQKLVATPGVDRPWLMELALGHLAAKQGDLNGAREHLGKAVAAQPGNAKVAAQAKASLAIAISGDFKLTPAFEDEVAKSMNGIDKSFTRLDTVRTEVRDRLSAAYARAGKVVESEFLRVQGPENTKKWSEVPFLKEMIARTGKTATDFDRFLLANSKTRPDLERELASRYIVNGDFASAKATFAAGIATSDVLHTDPFVMHVVDCHDCDHEKYANAKWTHASFAAKLADLEVVAKAGGEAGAEAAIQLGNALYNLTWHGNARVILEGTHAETRDSSPAERWYKLAYDTSKNRETKVRAAFFAAKAELGVAVGEGVQLDPLPVPTKWFPIVKSFSDTKYYKEILRECGHFARWTGATTPRKRP